MIINNFKSSVPAIVTLGSIHVATILHAQDWGSGTDTALSSPKKLSIEELLSVKVKSVSRRAEKIGEASSALQAITQNVPEALRLVPNLQVAQVNSSQWSITSTGFNNVLANKLPVMIDGRTVYDPCIQGYFGLRKYFIGRC